MSGWERSEADWITRHRQKYAGTVWSELAVLMDLRMIQGECLCGILGKWPGKRALGARWGWSEAKAYRIVKGEEWHDPARAERWAAWMVKQGVNQKWTRSGPEVDHSAQVEAADSAKTIRLIMVLSV